MKVNKTDAIDAEGRRIGENEHAAAFTRSHFHPATRFQVARISRPQTD